MKVAIERRKTISQPYFSLTSQSEAAEIDNKRSGHETSRSKGAPTLTSKLPLPWQIYLPLLVAAAILLLWIILTLPASSSAHLRSQFASKLSQPLDFSKGVFSPVILSRDLVRLKYERVAIAIRKTCDSSDNSFTKRYSVVSFSSVFHNFTVHYGRC